MNRRPTNHRVLPDKAGAGNPEGLLLQAWSYPKARTRDVIVEIRAADKRWLATAVIVVPQRRRG